MNDETALPGVSFDTQGLIPAVVQSAETGAVIMLAYMNADALRLTRETGRTHFWSRSRQTLWRKGESSGNEQIVHEILVNCYADSLLIHVTQIGPGCHTDHETCYYRRIADDGQLHCVTMKLTDLQRWYGAYEFLRDNDLTDISTTSRLLHAPRPGLEGRLADELVELAEVLGGTHRHSHREEDVILEASQSLYWLALLAVRGRLESVWLEPLARSRKPVDLTRAIDTLILSAEYWGEHATDEEPNEPVGVAAGTAITIADAVRAAHVDLEAVLGRDLTELRSKPYLSSYFASVEPPPS